MTDYVNTQPELPDEADARRPLRLWNRWSALGIAVIFIALYILSQIVAVVLLAANASALTITVVTVLTSTIVGIGSILLINALLTKHSLAALGFTAVSRRWLGIATLLSLVVGIVRAFGLDWRVLIGQYGLNLNPINNLTCQLESQSGFDGYVAVIAGATTAP